MTDYLTRESDYKVVLKLRDEAKEIEQSGKSVALTKRDWYIGAYSYLNHRHILLLDQDKELIAIIDESELLHLFGHQIWLAFLRRVGISEFIGFDQRPRIDGIKPTGRLGVPPWNVYGAQISEIINWVP